MERDQAESTYKRNLKDKLIECKMDEILSFLIRFLAPVIRSCGFPV